MKRVLKLISAFLFVLVYACDSEQVTLSYPSPSTSPILSRGESDGTSLPIDSKILLNASGGLSLVNEVFTYNGSFWTSGQDIRWTDTQAETTVTALYPTYTDNEYTSGNLYAKGVLEDVLIAQKTLSEKETIELQFKHLFSSLTLSIEPALEANIQEFTLSVPVKVAQISPQDGSFTLSQETHTVLQSINGCSEYSFILPPCENCVLSLLVSFKDGTSKVVTFDTHTFQSGTQYECNITSTDSRPGIRNATDLIDFSRLINGYEPLTPGRILADFGEEIDGVMTYRLLADIVLTEEECSKLAPIGDHSSTPFEDIFDGENHSITNLVLPDKNTYNKHSGLFGYVEETGIVKNLHINKASSIASPSCSYIGVIVASNNGTIDNCSVSNSNIYTTEGGRIGTICALSAGIISNCYSKENILHGVKETYIGGIAACADNMIINCYSYKNNYISNVSSDNIGSIIGGSIGNKLLNIRNCYIYHNNSDWYSAIGLGKKASIKSFYYNKGNLTGEKIDKPTQDVEIYDTNFKFEGEHISTLLNNWIDTTGKDDDYINYTFRQWKVADDGSACFE